MTAVAASQVITVNPATGAALRTYDSFAPEHMEEALQAVHTSQRAWAQRGVEKRAATDRYFVRV